MKWLGHFAPAQRLGRHPPAPAKLRQEPEGGIRSRPRGSRRDRLQRLAIDLQLHLEPRRRLLPRLFLHPRTPSQRNSCNSRHFNAFAAPGLTYTEGESIQVIIHHTQQRSIIQPKGACTPFQQLHHYRHDHGSPILKPLTLSSLPSRLRRRSARFAHLILRRLHAPLPLQPATRALARLAALPIAQPLVLPLRQPQRQLCGSEHARWTQSRTVTGRRRDIRRGDARARAEHAPERDRNHHHHRPTPPSPPPTRTITVPTTTTPPSFLDFRPARARPRRARRARPAGLRGHVPASGLVHHSPARSRTRNDARGARVSFAHRGRQ